MNGTPILSETAGYGQAGLRLRYAFAGPDNAGRQLRGSIHETDAEGGIQQASGYHGDKGAEMCTNIPWGSYEP